MCLDIKVGTDIMVAKKDIKVYKRLYATVTSSNLLSFKLKLESPIMGLSYKINKLYKSSLARYGSVIEDGLHAYTTKTAAYDNSSGAEIIFEATIPKDSQYYLGKGNHIASSQLIIYSESPVWYKNKKYSNLKELIMKDLWK